jgi:leucine dehydrogenase
MWPYPSEEEALNDVLRLSKGMTYKSALAGLDIGGGKSVIIGDPRTDKNEALLRAMGRFLNELHGAYIAAEDSGTCVSDLKIMAEETPYITGIHEKRTLDGQLRSGDPSPSTARGTFIGLQSAVKYQLGLEKLDGLQVAIQGLGNVGFRLAELLSRAGVKLWVTDINSRQVELAVRKLGAIAVPPEAIFSQKVDVFAPCAMGAILNDQSIPQLKANIIAGAANNQLAERRHGLELQERGILYAPDYVINAGGIIDVYFEETGFDEQKLNQHIDTIYDNLQEIFIRAERQQLPTNVIADQMAEEQFTKH